MTWAMPSARATHAPHRANLRCLGLSVGIAIADAVAVVALVTLFIRRHLVLLSQADGWSYGAANIGLAVFLWGLARGCFASAIEARRAETSGSVEDESAVAATSGETPNTSENPHD